MLSWRNQSRSARQTQREKGHKQRSRVRAHASHGVGPDGAAEPPSLQSTQQPFSKAVKVASISVDVSVDEIKWNVRQVTTTLLQEGEIGNIRVTELSAGTKGRARTRACFVACGSGDICLQSLWNLVESSRI
uniref:Uncharacterized protein n=1 Tax=Chromera velia CCMP2878 TaxID=1169474 RepID=A0A0G4H6G8_9ALVE|eukprot:Cvel_5781.t1-p1 / transcript=Cvel_5781.t1 / gene=Cvel_5781 / organism=Chromera_velia_CCMP2878 / gene_product=hypothetical protein / transcript_product=hypothetical protein / location=Cvel_scaffold274:100348-102533(-) / protein_length=131 / sequence_SO=supercontig / SO=protein_coding / is_pseudo=false